MKLTLLTSLIVYTLCITAPATAEDVVYLSAGDKVTAYRVNERSGELTSLQSIDLPGAGPMAGSPRNEFLYVNAATTTKTRPRKRSSTIATFRIAEDGPLRLLHQAPTNMSAAYLLCDRGGKFLAGNHYGPGKVSTWKLEDGLYSGNLVQEIDLEPKAHSVMFDPSNRFLLVPATGPNKVFQLRFDPVTGELTHNDPPFAEGPRGGTEAQQPRHSMFHPTLPILYTTNERTLPGVGVWSWGREKGTLKTIQSIVTYPNNFQGQITTADLQVTPDGRFVYISNRDVTAQRDPEGQDSIVGFAVDATTGKLKLIGHFPCERIPRSFTMNTAGRFIYVAGQGDARLGVYAVHPEDGTLKKVFQYPTGSRPNWVHCVRIKAAK